MLASAVAFLLVAPFAKEPLQPVWAFIPIYQSALVIGDLITALLLFGQFSILRLPALLALAAGYLFTACITAAHTLTFPGLFAAGGLLGAGPQSTAWLYMFWHGGFPLAVIAYALLGARREQQVRRPLRAIGATVLAVGAAVAVLVLVATAAHDALPPIMRGNRYTPAMLAVVTTVWLLSVLAFIAVWRRQSHTLLDLLLMIIMCAWVFDVGLSAVLNGGRFDLGFYAGRLYGLVAATAVLAVLLVENTMLYAGLARAYAQERAERERAQRHAQELVLLNKELDAFSYSVSHDLQAPLRAIQGYSQILEEGHGAQLDEEGRRLVGVVSGNARTMSQLIRDLLEFSRLGRQRVNSHEIDMQAEVRQVIDALRQSPEGARARFEVDTLPQAVGDRALLRQVWANLLSNAVKYSATRPDPLIVVRGQLQGGECVFSVQDHGVGFDMRYYDRLFGLFRRLHRSEDFPGTGVGLAIVQRVVARHGGRVWAESRVGEGAQFFFALPESLPGARGAPESDWGIAPSTT